MRTLRLALTEITRHHRPMQRLAIAFLLIVPTLYGALYLWSNWDPYGQLDEVPVAVVNLDESVTVEGTEVAAGDQLVDNLFAEPIFGWEETTAKDAADGLEAGDYYITITIPSTFSSDLASGADGTPRKATVDMQRNDANGFVVGIMAETVQSKLQGQINAAATQAYFESVYGSLDTLHGGLDEAHSGAQELADGLPDALDGAEELSDGLVTAVEGADEIADGASQVAQGTDQIAKVVNPVAETIAPAIPVIASDAEAVADASANLTDLAAGATDSVSSRTDDAAQALEDLKSEDPDIADSEAFQALQESVDAIDGRAGEIADTANGVNDTAQKIHSASEDAVAAAPELQQDVEQAQGKINELNSGAQQVSEGAGELAKKLRPARDGAAELADGLSDAAPGSQELADGLDEMLEAVPALDPDTREANAQILGDPTDVNLAVDNPADTYGRGLAPFFFAISLWVFGIVVFLIMRPSTGRAFASRAHPIRIQLVGWLPVFGVGLIGAYLLFAISWFALGLDPVSPGAALLTITVTVALFTLIAHLARNALGLVGSAVLLVLLMLQLTSSAGIYPVETLPGLLRAIHPYLPMSYVVDALRIVFTGGSSAKLATDLTVLSLLAVAVFVAGVAISARKRTWKLLTVHPPLAE